ncbi:MAG: bifunctional adenosylcobinamide kinase/adenosylcobinamide-phosphate guanylyltransferase [Pseudorhodobacter sp.]
MTNLPPLTLVIGGAKSGKSGFAEKLLVENGRPPVYIATAEARDAEIRNRIKAHRRMRGDGWRTLEAPRDLSGALAEVNANEAVLIDCMTFWLSNLMLAGADPEAEVQGLFAALSTCGAPVTLVSNELGWSIVPENALARRFRDVHGRLNQELATRADRVAVVISGLPLWLKGGT